MPRPNIDVFGQCIMCGTSLIEERVIDGKVVTVFKANRTETTYLLSDGSQMKVAMCKKCKESLDGTESAYVMKAVVRGWQHELETYSDWKQEQKDKYMGVYGKKKIVVRSDNKQKDVLTKHFNEYKVKEAKLKKDK